MAFERFTKTGRGYKPKVSIWSSGQIGFNSGSVVRNDLDKYKYAILYFDKDTRRIGVEFTNDEGENNLVKTINRSGGVSFSARAFLDYYDIDYSKTKKYDVEYDENDNLYVIPLDQSEK
jgi:hypothetical protein